MSKEYINILHMSDFHFKEPGDRKTIIDESFKGLIEKLIEIDSDTPIDVIVVSGDIGFSGCRLPRRLTGDWHSRQTA